MIWKSLLAFSLPLLAVTSVVTWKAYSREYAPTIALDNPNLNCTGMPVFTTGYQRDLNGVTPVGKGFNFQGVAWVEAELCRPGTLQLTAEGEAANGQGPILEISLNSKFLDSETFSKRRNVSIRVPHTGRLTLGYFNDFYLSDARVATLENIRFSGSSCKTIEVLVPSTTGGQWKPEIRTASLVFSTPMTITPCSTGTLSLQVTGRAGMQIFPLLEFRQRGKLLLTVKTGPTRQNIQMISAAAPLTVTLTNPYFKQIADRNLKLLAIQFVPDPVSIP